MRRTKQVNQQPLRTDLDLHHGSVLSATEYRAFILDWSRGHFLEVYRIDESGSIVRIMASPRQPETALNITAIGVATRWGASGSWKIGSRDIPWLVGPIAFARDDESDYLEFAPPDVHADNREDSTLPWYITPPLEEMGSSLLDTRQPELINMELSCVWRDQGWGNRKGAIKVRLAGVKEWQLLSSVQVGAPHAEEQFIAKISREALLGNPSFPLRLELGYVVGGGGGHELHIRDSKLRIRFSYRQSHLQFIEKQTNNFHTLSDALKSMNPKQFHQDERYKEALCSAIEYKQKCVKLLLAPNIGRIDPVHAMVAEGHHEVLEKILDMGFDPDVYDKLGFTPLMIASLWGLLDAARILIRGGAKPELTDKGRGVDDSETCFGSNALMMALMRGNFDVADVLLEPTMVSDDINRKDNVSADPLS